jgi:hypothetical protein
MEYFIKLYLTFATVIFLFIYHQHVRTDNLDNVNYKKIFKQTVVITTLMFICFNLASIKYHQMFSIDTIYHHVAIAYVVVFVISLFYSFV